MLSSDLESPFVSETSVRSHLEESFDIFSQLGFQDVGGHLEVFAFFVVALSVEEPTRNAMAFGFSNYLGNSVSLLFGKFSSSEVRVDSEDFADEVTETSSDSLDFVEGEGDSSFAVNVGVQDTVNMLEVVFCVFDNQRHLGCG